MFSFQLPTPPYGHDKELQHNTRNTDQSLYLQVGSGEIVADEDEWEDVEEVDEICESDEPQEHVQAFSEAPADSRREIVFINSSHQTCPPGAAIIYATLNSVGFRKDG